MLLQEHEIGQSLKDKDRRKELFFHMGGTWVYSFTKGGNQVSWERWPRGIQRCEIQGTSGKERWSVFPTNCAAQHKLHLGRRTQCDVQGVVCGEVGKSHWEEWETMLPELTLQYDGPAEARDLKASVVPTCPFVDSCSAAWCREEVGGEGGWRSAEGRRARILRWGTKRRAGRTRKGGPWSQQGTNSMGDKGEGMWLDQLVIRMIMVNRHQGAGELDGWGHWSKQFWSGDRGLICQVRGLTDI